MIRELRECPFCGKKNIGVGNIPCSFGTDIYIKCINCNAKIQICEEYGWDELYEKWNRRVADEQ